MSLDTAKKVDRRRVSDGKNGWDTLCRVDQGIKHMDRAKQLYRAGKSWIRKGQSMDPSVAGQYINRGNALICNTVATHHADPAPEMYQQPTPNRKSALSELLACYRTLREHDLNPAPPLILENDELKPNPSRVQCEKLLGKIFGKYRMTPNRLGLGEKATQVWKQAGIYSRVFPPNAKLYHNSTNQEIPTSEYGRVLYNLHRHYGKDLSLRSTYDTGTPTTRPTLVDVNKACPIPSTTNKFFPSKKSDGNTWSAMKAIEEIPAESAHSRKPRPKNPAPRPSEEQVMLQHALFLLCAPSTPFLRKKLKYLSGKYIIDGHPDVPYKNLPGEGYVQRTSQNKWTKPIRSGWAAHKPSFDVIGPLRVDPEFCSTGKRLPGPNYKPSRRSRDIYVVRTRNFANGSWGLEVSK